jgi:protoporphyrinogen oxidase
MSDSRRILVIGGGFTGLTAARELARDPALSITLVERENVLGGLAAGFPFLGTHLEQTYHHLFLTDTAILALVDELGLRDRLMWCDSSVGIYRDGRVHAFMSPLDLLRFSPCSVTGRLRLGLTALRLKHQREWRSLIGIRAVDWMSRACGPSAMETVWTPLLKGKFDRYSDSVSMAWLWARIHTRANSRPPGGGREQLGYFHGGFASVIRALEADLRKRNVRIETGATIERLSARERTAFVNGRPVPFEVCLFTGSSPAFAALLPQEDSLAAYARQLRSIDYLGAVCLVFASDQDLGNCYWLNVNEPGAPFLVFLNHTRLVDKRHYQSRHVYYIGAYAPADTPRFAMTDDALSQMWWAYLRKMFPSFEPGRVQERHLFRFKAAQHIVDTHYERKIPAYRTPLPGVFLANFSQIFPEDRGTNFAVREGLKVAALVRQELAGPGGAGQ